VGCPRRAGVAGVEEGDGGGVWTRGAHGKGKEVEMGQVSSTGTTGQKREGRGVDAGAGHGGDDVAAGGSSGGHGARGKGQQGRARAAADVQVTRGEGGSRRWSGSGQHSGGRGRCTALAVEEAEQSRACQRKKGGGSEGSY
jgi:hypothetical protein